MKCAKIYNTFKVMLFLLGLVLMTACASHVPTDATNVVDLGNGWHKFCLDGKRYIYHVVYSSRYHGGRESIARIPEEDRVCDR